MSDPKSAPEPDRSVPPAAESEGPGDRLFVFGVNETGDSYQVLRNRDQRVELGELRTLPEGKPIHGEVVRLHPSEEHEQIFDVEVVVDPKKATRSGPAQVATQAYREHWDAIFGQHDTDELN